MLYKTYYRTVPFITTCMGKALHDLALCMLSTTCTYHTKFSPFTYDAAYLEVWNHVLCNTNKVLGEKPAKRRFGRLFTTKELYGVVQVPRGSIIGIYASLITIPVHVHVVHFSESVLHALKANCIAGSTLLPQQVLALPDSFQHQAQLQLVFSP